MKLIMGMFLVVSLLANAEEPTFKMKDYKEHHSMGLKRDKAKLEAFKQAHKKHRVIEGQVIPGKYDLSPLVSPPEDQGQCGSCWDFSITKAMRSALMLVNKDPGRLAFNYLLNNCGPGSNEYGCNGGDFNAGDNMLNGHGPWLESQDPYHESEGQCKTGLNVAGTALEWVVVGNGSNAPSFQELASALSQKHMLAVDVAVCGSWGSYSSGIFNKNQCGAGSINHMINMNGYDCESSVDAQGNCVFDSKGMPVNKDGYLIAMNNWGNSWGEDGYMRSRYGIDALADTAMYFTVQASPPVPPTPPTPPVPPTPPTPPQPDHAGIPWWVWVIAGGLVIGVAATIIELKLAQKD